MKSITIYEGVLNDDYIEVDSTGKATLVYYTFATEWSNNKHLREFFSLIDAVNWYIKNFCSRVQSQGSEWYREFTETTGKDIYTLEEYWKDSVLNDAYNQ